MLVEEGDAPRAAVYDGVGALSVKRCALNGGGELEDGYDVHKLLYFDVIWRDCIG